MPDFEYTPPNNLAPIDWGAPVTMEIMAEYNAAGTLVEFWSVDPMDPKTPGYVREAWRRMRGDVARERERAEMRTEQGRGE